MYYTPWRAYNVGETWGWEIIMKEILKCRCKPSRKCSAPLHGKIEITNCEKNCGLGCDK